VKSTDGRRASKSYQPLFFQTIETVTRCPLRPEKKPGIDSNRVPFIVSLSFGADPDRWPVREDIGEPTLVTHSVNFLRNSALGVSVKLFNDRPSNIRRASRLRHTMSQTCT
jgi:hypothetical protein